jgi:hypothetical protein
MATNSYRGWLCTAVTLFLLLPAMTAGQQLTGSIAGSVADATGGVMPGVTVELSSSATGQAQIQVSDAAGKFVFNAVTPGSYTLKASLDGFKTVTRAIAVELNRVSRVEFALEVGSLAETVVVQGVTTAIDTVSSQVATNVDSKVVTDLPNLSNPNVNLSSSDFGLIRTKTGGGRTIQLQAKFIW